MSLAFTSRPVDAACSTHSRGAILTEYFSLILAISWFREQRAIMAFTLRKPDNR